MENNQNQLLGPRRLIIKDELVRLIIQFLYSFKYNDSAARLEAESNISNKSSQFVRLQTAVENGNWEECIQILVEIKGFFKTEDNRARVLKNIIEQWMQEYICKNDIPSALTVLRRDFPELEVRKEMWHELAMKLLNIYYGRGVGEDTTAESRKALVSELEKLLLPPPIVVEENRLITLLEMHLDYQKEFCRYHNIRGPISLYEFHDCGKKHFPTTTVQTLTEHKDEVWFVEFSNEGNYMVSSSKDLTAIIWEVPEQGDFTIKHTLIGHEEPVSFASWSSDDKMLATCGYKEVVKLWNVETGDCIKTFDEYAPALSSCAWIPYSKELVFAKSGPNSCIYKFDLADGEVTELLQNIWGQITDLVIADLGEYLLCSYMEGYIISCNLHEEYSVEKYYVRGDLPITSLSLSETGKYLLVNLAGTEIQMLDISHEMTEAMTFEGYKQSKFVIGSTFGGLSSRFIASGSEDSKVYIWCRKSYVPIQELSGHSMAVNSVSWNPKWLEMLASASDDGTIRIWGLEGKLRNAS